ncbi:head decoration protein [Agrobacterium rhizogenes]|nr:head decoration protein [Rhizobium rhizogenes]
MGILPVMKFQQTPGMSTLLKKEVDAEICRSVGTLAAGEAAARTVKMGQLVGKIVGTEQAPAGAKLGKLVAWDPSATDGSQIVYGVCLKDCEAPVGVDLVGGILCARRLSVLNRAAIVWPADATDAEKAAALEDIEERLGLIVRA